MNYWHLIFQVPAIIAGATIVSDLLPFSLDRRYVTLLVFLVSLAVLALPAYIGLSLGLVLGVSVLNKYLGVSFSGKEPLVIPSGNYQAVMSRISRKKEVTEFLTRDYPEEPAVVPVGRKFVPDLLGT